MHLDDTKKHPQTVKDMNFSSDVQFQRFHSFFDSPRFGFCECSFPFRVCPRMFSLSSLDFLGLDGANCKIVSANR